MPRLKPHSGFTLVELLVALTVFALIGSALTTVMTSQLRMYRRTGEATRVQRDLRTGLSLLPTDLRGASRTGGNASDLTLLVDSAVQLRATVGTSIVCAKPAANQIDIPPQALARNALTTWYVQPQPGDSVLAYNDSTSVGPEDDVWTTMRISAFAAAPAAACVGAPFTDPVLDPPASKPRWRLTFTANVPPNVKVGAPIRFMRSVRYSLFRPAGAPADRWYVGYREYAGGAWGAPEPIAGPFTAYNAVGGSGIAFAFYDSNGVRLPTPAAGTSVSRIDLTLRARSQVRGGRDSVIVRDSVAVRVALRNRW
jgi:prepilin-type N-terminal cleavage/methylation domain-containing protein